MKLRRNKKGFTIVELVIVIAVIAILAAVLIPTFISLTAKANKAADESLVSSLNKALAIEEVDHDIDNMHDAVECLKREGYLVSTLVTKSDQKLLYSLDTNRFLLEEDKDSNIDDYKYWTIQDSYDASKQTYSIYATDSFETATIENLKVGFDAGDANTIESISYVGNGATAQEVVIRTNGGSLTIGESASVVAKGQIWHFGTADNATIYSEDDCFHTHAKIGQMNLEKGKAIAEDKGYVALVQAAENTIVEEKDTGIFYIPSNATTATVDADVAATLGYTVTSTGTTANETRAAKVASIAYVIANKFDIIAFRNAVNKGNPFGGITVKVTNDIDLENEAWTPIGIKWENAATNYAAYPLLQEQGVTGKTIFSGIFEGNNHTISGLLIENGYYGGLFGRVGDATIKDLTVKGRVYGTDSAGVVGRANTGTVTLSNIVADVTVGLDPNSTVLGKGKTAGLVAYSDCPHLVVDRCVNKGAISTSTNSAFCAGLVAGGSFDIKITNSRNEGALNATGSQIAVGGIIARYIYGTLTIENCENTANINCLGANQGSGTIFSWVGGIAGTINNSGNDANKENSSVVFKDLTNKGDVTGDASSGGVFTGGILGDACIYEGTFSNLTNTGKVSGMIAGGIIGSFGAQRNNGNGAYKEDAITLEGLVNKGSVIGNRKTAVDIVCLGGLAGNVGSGYITFGNNCSAKEATIASEVEATMVLTARLIGNIINSECRHLVVTIPETIEDDPLNTFGKIGTTVYDGNGNPSTLYYHGQLNGTIINVNNLSSITCLD